MVGGSKKEVTSGKDKANQVETKHIFDNKEKGHASDLGSHVL